MWDQNVRDYALHYYFWLNNREISAECMSKVIPQDHYCNLTNKVNYK